MTDAPELKPCPFCGVMPEVTNGMISHPYAESKDGACVLAGLGISIVHSKWNTEQITAWNTRADLAKPRVKPLVWRKDESWRYVGTPVGCLGPYCKNVMHSNRGWYVAGNVGEIFNTADEAKAAAQADYEARVLACLEGYGDE